MLNNKTERLLEVLDSDIEQLERSLARLDELRRLVIKRDEPALGQLLAWIAQEIKKYKSNGVRRSALCRELAAELGCVGEVLTLRKVEDAVGGELSMQVSKKRQKLTQLSGEFARKHSATVMLVAECARFNSMLLKNLMETGGGNIKTYGRSGAAQDGGAGSFMNFRF